LKTIFYLVLLFSLVQAEETWISYEVEREGLTGYKDAQGKIKIEAKFAYAPSQFLNIVGVVEKKGDEYLDYYLFKNGTKVPDQLYFFDNSPDCESEGTIRFKQENKIGILDKNAKVLIPAEYSVLTPMKNHMTIVLKGAEKMCHNGREYSNSNRCEHPRFVGGRSFLMNDRHEVLIEDFDYPYDISLYDFVINDKNISYETRDNFKDINGNYYAFLNYKKEFTLWLHKVFIPDVLKGEMKKHIFKKLPEKEYKQLTSSQTEHNVTKLVADIKSHKSFIVSDSLTIYDNENNMLDRYFDTCNHVKELEYPGFSFILDYRDTNREYYQKRVSFFRSEDGYKLTNIYLGK